MHYNKICTKLIAIVILQQLFLFFISAMSYSSQLTFTPNYGGASSTHDGYVELVGTTDHFAEGYVTGSGNGWAKCTAGGPAGGGHAIAEWSISDHWIPPLNISAAQISWSIYVNGYGFLVAPYPISPLGYAIAKAKIIVEVSVADVTSGYQEIYREERVLFDKQMDFTLGYREDIDTDLSFSTYLNFSQGHRYGWGVKVKLSSDTGAAGVNSAGAQAVLTSFVNNCVVQVADIPSPLVQWIDQGANSSDSQKVKIIKPSLTCFQWKLSTSLGSGTNTTGWMSSSTSDWTDTGVFDEQTVKYKIQVKDEHGNLYDESQWGQTTIDDRTPPTDPSTPNVVWNDQGPNSGDIQSVTVSKPLTSGATKVEFNCTAGIPEHNRGPSSVTSYTTPSDVHDNQTYKYRSRMWDNNNNYSNWSSEGSCQISDRTPPIDPSAPSVVWNDQGPGSGDTQSVTVSKPLTSGATKVEFDCTAGIPEHNRGLSSETSYTTPRDVHDNQTYKYRCKMWDDNNNSSNWSPEGNCQIGNRTPAPIVTVTLTDEAPYSVTAGQKNVNMVKLSLSTNNGIANWKEIKVDRIGTGTNEDVSMIKIWADNGDKAYDSNQDIEIGSGKFNIEIVNIKLQEQNISTTPKFYFVTIDIADVVSETTNTVGVKFGDESYFTFDPPADISGPTSFPFESGKPVLPVELSSFSGTVQENMVKLHWTTVTETNNFGFEIQRCCDNDIFNTIGFVKGHGTTSIPQSYCYIDRDLKSNTYYYKLKQIDIDGSFEYSEIVEAIVNKPQTFELSQNYPNPFNPETEILFQIPAACLVKLKIFNVLGVEICTLTDSFYEAGYHRVRWDGKDDNENPMPSGVYFYQIQAGHSSKIYRMILLR